MKQPAAGLSAKWWPPKPASFGSFEESQGLVIGQLLVVDPQSRVGGLGPIGTFRTTILREAPVSLSNFRFRTHPESSPAGATRSYSLLLVGQDILGADLHEWLFLLVTV